MSNITAEMQRAPTMDDVVALRKHADELAAAVQWIEPQTLRAALDAGARALRAQASEMAAGISTR
jgi:hypothetical protein